MPSVSLDRKTVESLLNKKVTQEQLREHIVYLGTDLEDINKKTIEVEIFPNRPDLLSEQGLARALNKKMGFAKGMSVYKPKKSDYVVSIDPSVADVRPFTRCVVVKGLKLSAAALDQIIQVQEKMHITFGRKRKKVAIGVYPLDHITFPVTYKAESPKLLRFTPLDATKEMNGLEILEEHQKGQEYADLLKGCKVFPVFRDANNEVLSMPPIINSEKMGKVDASTKDVFVECSGTDELALDQAIAMLASMLADMGGNLYEVTITTGKKKIQSPNFSPQEVILDTTLVESTLGISLSGKKIVSLIEAMDMNAALKGSKISVEVPAWRTDVLHPRDVVEDIAIAYGYQNFKPELPKLATLGGKNYEQQVISKVSDLLVGVGINEVSPLVISPQSSLQEQVRLDDPVVLLENPATSEYNSMRNWLIPGLLDTLQLNKSHEYPQKIFCAGRVVNTDNKKVYEDERLGLALAFDGVNFTHVKQIAEFVAQQTGLAFEYKALKHKTFMEGRCAQILVGKKVVGIVGEIHPEVLSNFELFVPVASCELYMEQLVELID